MYNGCQRLVHEYSLRGKNSSEFQGATCKASVMSDRVDGFRGCGWDLSSFASLPSNTRPMPGLDTFAAEVISFLGQDRLLTPPEVKRLASELQDRNWGAPESSQHES
ncbi:hypothetical protein PoB_000497900 [Plakobranchus ocellatus]|uniref:Uncharacterized protein n=1 Tax=Plakobranchus ocellatus TaxID=259542 RepID=A0AAV3Y8T4_9GAST|nr:hypothetical protein PoB_000497900 [Plakobranchus ocellatus]